MRNSFSLQNLVVCPCKIQYRTWLSYYMWVMSSVDSFWYFGLQPKNMPTDLCLLSFLTKGYGSHVYKNFLVNKIIHYHYFFSLWGVWTYVLIFAKHSDSRYGYPSFQILVVPLALGETTPPLELWCILLNIINILSKTKLEFASPNLTLQHYCNFQFLCWAIFQSDFLVLFQKVAEKSVPLQTLTSGYKIICTCF